MTLTEKHITYENDCRQMLVGQIIRAVIYGEVKYFADENGNNINPRPYYNTKYSDVDTLDHSIYLKMDDKAVYITWDNTFISYGLQSALLDLTRTTHDYEQKWDVSAKANWTDLIGQKITGFNILWEETWTSNLDGSNKVYKTYPQTFLITTENKKAILIAAAEFVRPDENEIDTMMDNLLVTTNLDIARQLKMLDHPPGY